MFNQQDYRILDPLSYKNKISIMSKKTRTTIIPNYIQMMIVEKCLNYIEDENKRAKIFLKELFIMRLSNSTIAGHFKLMKPLLFKNSIILANSMVFDNKSQTQYEVPKFKNIDKLIEYIKTTKMRYKWPILLALYSGLKLKDITQFKVSHIIMLKKKHACIPMNTKTNGEWKVLYHEKLEILINHFTEFIFKKDCEFYLQFNVDLLLFPNISTSLLHCKLGEMYILANEGESPTLGFGLHILRHFFSFVLAKKRNIEFAEIYLGHKKIKTTGIYSNNMKINKQYKKKNKSHK